MWFDNKSNSVKENAQSIIDYAKSIGITNPLTIASILAVISKESEFFPQPELSYATTNNDRIRKIFTYRVNNLTDEQLNALKKDDYKFFEQVYGYKYPELGLGNNKVGDGFKYRGRGFNGITGKTLYQYFKNKTGVDIINNPELLNNPKVAGKVAVEYFKYVLNTNRGKYVLKTYYNNPKGDLNTFKSAKDAVNAFIHANAGIGFTKQQAIDNDVTGGVKKAQTNFPDMLAFVNKDYPSTPNTEKKK